MFFADYRRQHDFSSIGSYGKVGELVVVDQESDGVLSKFDLPAFFIITEVHGKPGEHHCKYTLSHQLTGEAVNTDAFYLYRAEEYFRLKAAFAKYVEADYIRQVRFAKSQVKLLSKVLASRGIVTVITEEEQVKLRALVELEEAKRP